MSNNSINSVLALMASIFTNRMAHGRTFEALPHEMHREGWPLIKFNRPAAKPMDITIRGELLSKDWLRLHFIPALREAFHEGEAPQLFSKKGLYVRRNLTAESALELHEWAKKAGFKNLVPVHEMHVTIVYSKKKIELTPKDDVIVINSGARSIEPLGDKGAVVLMLTSGVLSARWQEAMDAGATWDYDSGYKPHVTLSYDAGGMDLSSIAPPTFPIELNNELHEELVEDWAEKKGLRKFSIEDDESHVDYARIDKALLSLEARATQEIKDSLIEVRDKLVSKVEKGWQDDTKFITEFEAKGFGPVRTAVRGFLRDTFEMGRQDIRLEAATFYTRYGTRVFFPTPRQYADPMYTPREALRWLESKTFHVSGLIEDKIVAETRQVLLNALKFGEPLTETIGKLEDLFTPYVGDETVLKDGEPLSPHRLETIVRTNNMEAYNQGRLISARDPDMEGLIQGMLYSAILDTRTTCICGGTQANPDKCDFEGLHGKIFPMDEPALDRLSPPNHFNCRSMVVAVPAGVPIEGYEFITKRQIGEALDLAGKGFV